MPPKKRSAGTADKMSARQMGSVMDSTGTGDAEMDKLLRKETNRKVAFSNTVGTTARATNPVGDMISRLFGKKKKK